MSSTKAPTNTPQSIHRAKFSVAAALASLAVAALVVTEFPPHFSSEPHASIGKVLARQAAGLLGKGGKVIVVTRDTETFHQPSLDTLFDSFESALHSSGGTVDSVQRLQLDPAKPLEVPAGDFFELMRKAGPGSVIVSFMGPSFPTAEQFSRLMPGAVKVVAFCPGNIPRNVDLKKLFEIGVLQAAVIDRGSTQSAETSGQGADFDKLYLEITSANLSKLPSVGGDSL